MTNARQNGTANGAGRTTTSIPPEVLTAWLAHERRPFGSQLFGATTRVIALLCLWTLAGVMPAKIAGGQHTESHKPNIVIILADDMGYGDPGCFNPDSKIETPSLDRLAREGMRFLDAHAPGPLCHMSRYGLMTGRYPFRTDVSVWRRRPLIEEDQPTIASLAKAQGYHTAMVGKWHLGFEERGAEEDYKQPLAGGPVDRGFEEFFGIRASTDIPPYFYIRDRNAVQPPTNRITAKATEGWSPIQGEFWRAGGIAPDLKLEAVLPRFTDEAVSVIHEHASRENQSPLLLYVAFPAPHTPWLPDERFKGRSKVDLYGDFTMMVDHEVGRIVDALEQREMSNDTLVIFTSDNGPVWYDKDTERFGHDSAGVLRGMKSDAWEAGHRMPFVVRWPGKVKANSISNHLISFVDLMGTFSDIWQAELPPNAGPDSFSFLPALLQTDDQPLPETTRAKLRQELVLRAGSRRLFTIREGDWKLITGLGSGGFSKPAHIKPQEGDPDGQLYDLKNDLSESNNLYAAQPGKVRELEQRLQEIIERHTSR